MSPCPCSWGPCPPLTMACITCSASSSWTRPCERHSSAHAPGWASSTVSVLNFYAPLGYYGLGRRGPGRGLHRGHTAGAPWDPQARQRCTVGAPLPPSAGRALPPSPTRLSLPNRRRLRARRPGKRWPSSFRPFSCGWSTHAGRVSVVWRPRCAGYRQLRPHHNLTALMSLPPWLYFCWSTECALGRGRLAYAAWSGRAGWPRPRRLLLAARHH